MLELFVDLLELRYPFLEAVDVFLLGFEFLIIFLDGCIDIQCEVLFKIFESLYAEGRCIEQRLPLLIYLFCLLHLLYFFKCLLLLINSINVFLLWV